MKAPQSPLAMAPSVHVAALFAPPGQAVTPVRQGAPGLEPQVAPLTQATQAPLEQPLTHVVFVVP
jgi:hypothetical protein